MLRVAEIAALAANVAVDAGEDRSLALLTEIT
jgi:hypothetical protein